MDRIITSGMKSVPSLPVALLFLLLEGLLCDAQARLTVASLSSIASDLARNVGGDIVTVLSIVPTGTDPHEFQPNPSDIVRVAKADLVLYTGKGLEGYLTKLEQSTGHPERFLDLGKSIPSLNFKRDGVQVEDPHWWHSVGNMKIATRVVAEAFAKADPENAAVYEKNSAAYLASLDALERWIRVKLAALPHERRKLVTSHDALGYLAHDYGFTVYPIKGVSTGDEPSSKHVRELVHLIREQGVKAVFFESMENPRAMDQISLETGVKSGGILYADALGAEEASTYDSMMRHNMTVIVEGLR